MIRSGVVAAGLSAAASQCLAADRSWINIAGGTFTVLANWQNGLFAGVNDAACFNNSSVFFPPGQTNYTISFSANAQTQAVKVRNDFVTFDLLGRTFTTTQITGNEIGTVGGGSIQTARSARLTIQNGTFATANNSPITLGTVVGGLGSLTVTTGGVLTGSPRILLGGASAIGTLSVIGGGSVIANSVEVGSGASSVGNAVITGPFSSLTTGSLLVGNAGDGTMLINVGGVLQNNGTATVGNAVNRIGVATVDGATARWIQSGTLLIGNSGAGTANVINGGSLRSLATSIADVAMTVTGGAGTDTLSLDDRANFTLDPRSCTISASTIEAQSDGVTSGVMSYSGFNSFDYIGGSNDQLVTLNSQPAALPMLFETGDGDDTVRVGGGDIDSSGFTTANTNIIAGNGIDSIEFDDRLDGGGETESYTFDPFIITKGSAGVTYSAFENQTLLAADGGVAPFALSTIHFNAFSGTLIQGGTARSNTINFGSGNFTGLSGTTTLDLRAPADVVNFNAQSATGPRTFALSADQLTAPAAVNFTGVEDLNISTGQFADNISITGTAAGTAVGISGNLGDDLISIGGGDFGNMLSPVAVNGAAGNDFIRFLGNSDMDVFTATLRNNGLVAGGLTHSYINFELVSISTGPGGSNLTIQSVPFLTLPAISQTNVTGGDGDDLITIGTGNVLVGGNITVNGSSGNDTLLLDDASGSSASTYTFDQGNRFFKTFAQAMFTVVRSNFENTILDANGGNNTVNVDRTTSALTILSNAGNDTVNVLDSTAPVTVNTGTEATSTSPFGDFISINTDFAVAGDTAATVVVAESDIVLGLTLAQSGTLRLATGAVLEKVGGTGSVLTLNGTMDFAGGAYLHRAGQFSPIFRSLLQRGYAAGAWNGTSTAGAFNSSMAAGSAASDGVGYGAGSEIAPATIGPFAIAAGDTLLRYTLDGDADLSGAVDIADFARVAGNFNGTNKVWATGDSNYDNTTNIADFAPLAANFNQSANARLPQSRGARVGLFGAQRVGLPEALAILDPIGNS